jgi:hypothetical protein
VDGRAAHRQPLAKEQLVNRLHRTRHPSAGWGPAPGWGQPLPGWSPLVDHGPLLLRVVSSFGRWWWPTLALAGFGTVVGIVVGHDDPTTPGLSTRALATITLAALAVVLLTLHRAAGPGALARAAAEYTVVALLATLLAAAGAADQPPVDPATSATATQAKANPEAAADDHRPGLLRVGAIVVRAVTTAAKAVAGAARWLAELWRQADAKTDHPNRAPATTTPSGDAMRLSPAMASTSTRRPL